MSIKCAHMNRVCVCDLWIGLQVPLCEWHSKETNIFFIGYLEKCPIELQFAFQITFWPAHVCFSCRCNSLWCYVIRLKRNWTCVYLDFDYLSSVFSHFITEALHVVSSFNDMPIIIFFLFLLYFLIKKNMLIQSHGKAFFFFLAECVCVCVCAHAPSLDVFELKRCEFRILDAW